MTTRLVLILSVSILLSACGAEHKSIGEADVAQNPKQDQGLEQVTPPIPGLDFEVIRTEVLNSFTSNCADCHGWTNDYAQVLPRIESILDRVTREQRSPGFMPRGGESLTPDAIELLTAWAQSGAPEFTE